MRGPLSGPLTDISIAEVRFRVAGSTGRRNTGVKSLCWGFKLHGLTWPFVELTSHSVQMGRAGPKPRALAVTASAFWREWPAAARLRFAVGIAAGEVELTRV